MEELHYAFLLLTTIVKCFQGIFHFSESACYLCAQPNATENHGKILNNFSDCFDLAQEAETHRATVGSYTLYSSLGLSIEESRTVKVQ